MCELGMSPREYGIVEPGIVRSSQEAFVGILRGSADADGWSLWAEGDGPVILLFVRSKRRQGNLDCVSKVKSQHDFPQKAFQVL